MDGEVNKTIGELSVDVKLLVQKLRDVQDGEIITYETLSSTIRRNVQEHRGVLSSARRVAMREHSILFDTITNVGLKRLTNEDIPTIIGTRTRESIHRTTRRGVKKIGCAEYDKLSRPAQNQYNTTLSILGALTVMSGVKANRRVEEKVAESHSLLPNAETLSLLAE